MGKFALDVSNNRTATRVQVAASGAEILICKATERTSFKDVTLAIHREIAHELGIAFGSYVFLHPDSSGSEADYYLEYAKPKKGNIQPIIDAETFSGVFKHTTGIQALALRAESCAHSLERHGYKPILYCGPYTWPQLVKYAPSLKRLRVWEAQYPGPSRWSAYVAHLRMRISSATVVMWQYTDKYPVQGKTFDFSRVYATVASLKIA